MAVGTSGGIRRRLVLMEQATEERENQDSSEHDPISRKTDADPMLSMNALHLVTQQMNWSVQPKHRQAAQSAILHQHRNILEHNLVNGL
jgi:hypothetical protein